MIKRSLTGESSETNLLAGKSLALPSRQRTDHVIRSSDNDSSPDTQSIQPSLRLSEPLILERKPTFVIDFIPIVPEPPFLETHGNTGRLLAFSVRRYRPDSVRWSATVPSLENQSQHSNSEIHTSIMIQAHVRDAGMPSRPGWVMGREGDCDHKSVFGNPDLLHVGWGCRVE